MIDSWYVEHLACPTHGGGLQVSSSGASESFCCAQGCRFPVVQGVPVMLPNGEFTATHDNAMASLREAADPTAAGIVDNRSLSADEIDGWVQEMVAHTNSLLYTHLVGRLERYPIPEIPMEPRKKGDTLLDIGCGWGRWSLAAARKGFFPVGIDTSLRAALAATRVAQQLGLEARFVVADSRYLPFRPQTFDASYSYSVLQHFSKPDVVSTIKSLKPLMRTGGVSKLHLLNTLGLRSIMVQLRRGFREARGFEVRYWFMGEMLRAWRECLGPTRVEIDGFFVQGRIEDRALFRPMHRLIFDTSRALTRLSRYIPPLTHLADNLFLITEH
jgi:2-polyprenyl-3-methyl-5-hydroxy-6-metoxy-1,4-benzoquinol methylase/uncharacterized protein YbaR (Trm112 family)